MWDLRKVGRARDCEWVTSGRARLGLGSQVCRAALSKCGANGDCQIPGPLMTWVAMQAWDRLDGLTLCRRRSVQPAGCGCLSDCSSSLWPSWPRYPQSQRRNRAGGGVRGGLGCGGHCRGGVLSLCFSRSLKKLVGARDQVSSHSCVVARRLWYSGTLACWACGSSNARAERCPKMSIDVGAPRIALAHAQIGMR